MTTIGTDTNFCLSVSGTIVNPAENVTTRCSDKDSDKSTSQINGWQINKSYEQLKKGIQNVKSSDDTFICPYCPNKKRKRDYAYREILEHASGVGWSSSQNRSAIEKANHLALVKYLKKDLINVGGSSEPMDEGDQLTMIFNGMEVIYKSTLQESLLTLILSFRHHNVEPRRNCNRSPP